MKHGHIKSRLDECKKFDEECRLRYVAEKMYREMICRALQVPLEIFNYKPKPYTPETLLGKPFLEPYHRQKYIRLIP